MNSITVKFNVSKSRFAVALIDYYYRNSSEFDDNLKKQEAKKILKRELYWYGMDGEYTAGFFEASPEPADIRNALYDKAIEWLNKNYPSL